MRLKKTLAALAAVATCAAVSAPATAEPTYGPVQLNQVRVYDDGANAFVLIEVKNATYCSTSTFTFKLSNLSGAGMLSASLTALATGQRVNIEISNTTGCNGYGTQLQSITVLSQ
ncbi:MULTISPECIES: hypothetical protein [unclassified Caulobacter]|uniref:hypothetical protein n=1 Tax=unclassified Caulobacter TaxID=2648921 RepID=UPI0011B78A68|nr:MULTISPECIES: hypothetical protein [unclassified Caulobacter]